MGDPFGAGITAQLQALWVTPGAHDCTTLFAQFGTLPPSQPQASAATAAAVAARQRFLEVSSSASGISQQLPSISSVTPGIPTYANTDPTLTSLTLSPGTDIFLSDTLTLTAHVADNDGDAVRVRVTFFGVPAVGCSSSGCDNHVLQVDGSSSTGASSSIVTAITSYRRPGRYIVRVEATDFKGGYLTSDMEVIVRKNGDVGRAAKCCRRTGILIAAQAGRPISSTVYRDPVMQQYATALGWPTAGSSTSTTSTDSLDQYMSVEDVESERLFDWGLLAPEPATSFAGLLQTVSCADTRVAGAGSARAVGWGADQFATNHGHGKRLMVLPQVRDCVSTLLRADDRSCLFVLL